MNHVSEEVNFPKLLERTLTTQHLKRNNWLQIGKWLEPTFLEQAYKYYLSMKRCSACLLTTNENWDVTSHILEWPLKKAKTQKQQVLLKVCRKGVLMHCGWGMWNGTATMKDNGISSRNRELLKCCLVFQESMSFERWFESWENFRCRLRPFFFAIFCIILGPDFPFWKTEVRMSTFWVTEIQPEGVCEMLHAGSEGSNISLPSFHLTFERVTSTNNSWTCEPDGRTARTVG